MAHEQACVDFVLDFDPPIDGIIEPSDGMLDALCVRASKRSTPI
jgi:hypothetical protein